MELNRRDFLKGAVVSAAAAGVAGLAGCAPASSGADASQGAALGETGAAAEAAGKHSWEVVPDPITDVADTKDFDIVIVGAGPSGCAAAEAAAAAGASVALIEQAAGYTAHGQRGHQHPGAQRRGHPD